MLKRTALLGVGVLVGLAVGLFPTAPAQQPETPAQSTQGPKPGDDPTAYFLGMSVGQSMMSQGFGQGDFDPKVFAVGLTDALAEKQPALNQQQLQQAQQKIQAMMAQRQQQMQQQQQQAAAAGKQKATAWLQQNAQQEGVKTLPSGVQYKVLEQGQGESPSPEDEVKVHYTGKLTDGEVFDSSVERGQPATFQVQQVIKGWQVALTEMKEGGKWMLYIPPSLAYGERGSPPAIGPNEVLVFEVELLEVL